MAGTSRTARVVLMAALTALLASVLAVLSPVAPAIADGVTGGAVLSGSTLGPDGEPVQAIVEVWAEPTQGDWDVTVAPFARDSADDDGRWRVRVPAGRYRVGFRVPGTDPQFHPGAWSLALGQTLSAGPGVVLDGLDARLTREPGYGSVSGRAVSSRGSSVPYVPVVVTVAGKVLAETTAGADGRWSVRLPPGAYTFTHSRDADDAWATTDATATVRAGVAAQVGDVHLAADAGRATLGGTATGPDGPVAGAEVEVRPDLSTGSWVEGSRTTVTGADGAWAFAVEPGSYRVMVTSTELPRAVASATVGADEARLDLDTSTGPVAAPLSGRVGRPGGAAVGGAVVSLVVEDHGSWESVQHTLTGDDGRWRLRPPVGTYRVLVTDDRDDTRQFLGGHRVADATPVTADATTPRPGLDIELTPDPSSVVVTGTLRGADGAPLVGASVWLADEELPDGYGRWRVGTDATGHWRARVPSGPLWVRYSAIGYDGAVHPGGPLTLPPGSTRDLEATLRPTAGTGVLAGTVHRVDGTPYAGAAVDAYAYDADRERWSSAARTVAGPDGRWRLRVPAGTYRVRFAVEDEACGCERRQFSDARYRLGQAREIAVADGGAVSGIDGALGEPGAAVLVPVTRPVVTGQVRVGGRLTATGGTWAPRPAALRHQWFADGRPIAGATGASYVVRVGDRGTRLSVRVTARRSGYADGTADSAPTAAVARAAARLTGRIVRRGATTVVRVRVTAPVPVTGRVRVLDGGRLLGGVRLEDGRAVLRVRLAPGKHRVRVVYLGSPGIARATLRLNR